jgi:hypothetical protein
MVMQPDNSLVRASGRSEVWWIETGARRWVPDSETVESLDNGWAGLTLLRRGQTLDNPLGPMVPSVVRGYKWADGSLIQVPPDPHVYVMEAGSRRWITSPQVMAARGYNWNDIQPISSVEMNAIPLGQPDFGPPPQARQLPEIIVYTGRVFLGAGHYMETSAKFTRATGETAGSTTTETITLLGGFHGGVSAILTDVNQIAVPSGQSTLFRYGVDGTLIGNAKRTDGWSFVMDPGRTAAVENLTIFHVWAPDQFQVILDKWVRAGKSIAELVKSAQQVAAAVSAM